MVVKYSIIIGWWKIKRIWLVILLTVTHELALNRSFSLADEIFRDSDWSNLTARVDRDFPFVKQAVFTSTSNITPGCSDDDEYVTPITTFYCKNSSEERSPWAIAVPHQMLPDAHRFTHARAVLTPSGCVKKVRDPSGWEKKVYDSSQLLRW